MGKQWRRESKGGKYIPGIVLGVDDELSISCTAYVTDSGKAALQIYGNAERATKRKGSKTSWG